MSEELGDISALKVTIEYLTSIAHSQRISLQRELPALKLSDPVHISVPCIGDGLKKLEVNMRQYIAERRVTYNEQMTELRVLLEENEGLIETIATARDGMS